MAVPFSDSKTQVVFDDLTEKDIETVLPQSKQFATSTVMILSGPNKGELGHILSKDKSRQTVSVQLNEEGGLQILSVSMDDVCLYSSSD